MVHKWGEALRNERSKLKSKYMHNIGSLKITAAFLLLTHCAEQSCLDLFLWVITNFKKVLSDSTKIHVMTFKDVDIRNRMVTALYDIALPVIAPPDEAPSVRAQPDTSPPDISMPDIHPSLKRHPIQPRQ